jgi:hypothetical protein
MQVEEDVPEDSKAQPGGVEGGGEAEKGEAPREVNHRDEEVFQKPSIMEVLDVNTVIQSNSTSIMLKDFVLVAENQR